jgi:hypothetical protein
MSGLKAVRILGLVLIAGVLMSGCTSAPSVKIPASKVYGPPGYRFAVSFLRPPTERSFFNAVPVGTGFRTGVREGWTWTGGKVLVWVDVLTNVPPPSRINPFLRSYLPTTHGGRIISRFGLRAATETVPCSTPAGTCPGTVATLVFLDRKTVFEVSTSGLQSSDARKILFGFRIIG